MAVRRAFRALARVDHVVSERFLTVNTFCDTSDREFLSMFHREVDAEKRHTGVEQSQRTKWHSDSMKLPVLQQGLKSILFRNTHVHAQLIKEWGQILIQRPKPSWNSLA